MRPITPPPESPPQHRNPNKARGNRHISRSDGENLSFASSSRIETTVAQVVEKAAEYARRYEEVHPFLHHYVSAWFFRFEEKINVYIRILGTKSLNQMFNHAIEKGVMFIHGSSFH